MRVESFELEREIVECTREMKRKKKFLDCSLIFKEFSHFNFQIESTFLRIHNLNFDFTSNRIKLPSWKLR